MLHHCGQTAGPGEVTGILSLWEWLEKDVGKGHITMLLWDWGPLAGVWKHKDCQETVEGRSSCLASLCFSPRYFILRLFGLFTLCGQDLCSVFPTPLWLPLENSHIILQDSQVVSNVLLSSHCCNHCLGFPLLCAYTPGFRDAFIE